MKKYICWIAIVLLVGMNLFARNLPVVDFGDDYCWQGGVQGLPTYRAGASATQLYAGSPSGENTVDVDGDGETRDDSVAFYPFSLTDPLNPQGSFYNSKGMNSRFYGGLVTFFANKRPNWREGGINIDHELRDDFNLHSYATEGGDVGLRTYGLWLWKKEDFLNEGDRLPVALDAESRIAVYVSRYWKDYGKGRFVLREGDQFYISEYAFGNKTHTLFEVAPSETRWAAYTPSAPYDIAFDPSTADFQFRAFSDITAAGWYISKPDLGPAALWVKWYAFTLNAVVDSPLPEKGNVLPVSYADWRKVYQWGNRNQFGLNESYVYDRDGDMGEMAVSDAAFSAAESPVTDLTWLDALAWCNARSEYDGLSPMFYEDAALTRVLRRVVDRMDPAAREKRPEAFVDWKADGYRPAFPNEVSKGSIGLEIVRSDGRVPPKPDQILGAWKDTIHPVDLKAIKGSPALDLVAVTGGSYPRTDGAKVRISSFEMSRTEITYEQWMRVYAKAIEMGYSFDHDGDRGSMDWSDPSERFTADEPVTQISHLDAMLWCNALSELEGKTPVYYVDASKTAVLKVARRFRLENCPRSVSHYNLSDKGVQKTWTKWEADGYRLPTRWEWEYAYRAGNQNANGFPWTAGSVSDHAWVGENSGDRSHPVGKKLPNALGLYDMAGNVFEWTMGAGESYYMVDNPRGKEWPVPLGGSFRTDAKELSWMLKMGGAPRAAIQYPLPIAYPEIGFRVIRCEANVHPPEPPPYVPEVVLGGLPSNPSLQGNVWRGNLSRTGEFDAPGPISEPREAWRFDAGKPFRSSPVIVDGVVFAGNDNGTLYAIDLKTGVEKWSANLGAPIRSSVAVYNGRVFVINARGVHARDAETGAEIWKIAGGYWDDSPLLVPGPIQLADGEEVSGVLFVSIPWKEMFGVRLSDGKEVWRHRDGHGPGKKGCSALYTDGKIVYFRGSQATVVVDAKTERRLYEIDGGIDTHVFTPAAKDGMCYSYIRGVVGFNLNDNIKNAGGRFESFDFAWRFFPAGDDDWDTQHPGITSLSVDDRAVYFGHRNKNVYALNRETGEVLWKTGTGAPVESSPALGTSGLLFIGNKDGSLLAIDRMDGSIRWRHDVGSELYSSPALSGGWLVIGTDGGQLIGLSAP